MSEKLTKTLTQTVEKVTDVIIEPVKFRLSNPFIGSFAISWILFNWKAILLIILSSQSIEDKFDYIHDEIYYDNYGVVALFTILFPLAISAIYAFGLPRLENLIESSNLRPLTDKLNRHSGLTVVDLENKTREAEARAKLADASSSYKDLNDARAQIAKLEVEAAQTLSEHAEKQAAHDLRLTELIERGEEQQKILRQTIDKQQEELLSSSTREGSLRDQALADASKHAKELEDNVTRYTEIIRNLEESLSASNVEIGDKESIIRHWQDQFSELEQKSKLEKDALNKNYISTIKELDIELGKTRDSLGQLERERNDLFEEKEQLITRYQFNVQKSEEELNELREQTVKMLSNMLPQMKFNDSNAFDNFKNYLELHMTDEKISSDIKYLVEHDSNVVQHIKYKMEVFHQDISNESNGSYYLRDMLALFPGPAEVIEYGDTRSVIEFESGPFYGDPVPTAVRNLAIVNEVRISRS